MSTFSTWPGLAFVPWLVFGVIWGVGALSTKRTVQREGPRQMLTYRPPLTLGCILLFTPWGTRTLPALAHAFWPADATSGLVGLALSCAGIGFAIWARVHLGKYWSGAITLKEGHKLITSGPYGLARHPIYTGITLSALGSAIAIGDVSAFIGFSLIVGAFVWKLMHEERLMAQTFGEEHAQYRARVKRLVPGVW